MAGLWVVNADDIPANSGLADCPSIVLVRGEGRTVYVGNSRHSPSYGAQIVKPGDLIPMFIS